MIRIFCIFEFMKNRQEIPAETPLKSFIRRNSYLFWSVPENEKENVSNTALLETVLNYAELPVIKEFFDIITIDTAASVFYGLSERQKGNLYPEIYHFFSKYFEKYASRNIIKRTN